jgi:hypothetical protein
MKQKLLFMVFTDEDCRRNHAFMYALECSGKGHEVKLILEGPATACLSKVNEGSKFGELFKQAKAAGLIAGACKTAAGGCSTGSAVRNVAQAALGEGIELIADLAGHAGIERFVAAGYQVIVF